MGSRAPVLTWGVGVAHQTPVPVPFELLSLTHQGKLDICFGTLWYSPPPPGESASVSAILCHHGHMGPGIVWAAHAHGRNSLFPTCPQALTPVFYPEAGTRCRGRQGREGTMLLSLAPPSAGL